VGVMLLKLPNGRWMAACPIQFCSWNFQHKEKLRCRVEFDAHWEDYHERRIS